jgi:hypothetical protein
MSLLDDTERSINRGAAFLDARKPKLMLVDEDYRMPGADDVTPESCGIFPDETAAIPPHEEFIPLADFIASPPPANYLVKGVFPAKGMCQVFGSSNVGKSFLMIDLAMHIAAGLPWRGCRTRQSAVLYIAAEGLGGLAGRMKAWTLRYGRVPDRLFIRPFPVHLTSEGAAAALAERIRQLPVQPQLIILDTLAANFGPGDENSAQDMALAMMGLRQLSGDWLGMFVHHSGHADKTRSRGHSSLYAALDLEIQVSRAAPGGPIKVAHTKCRDLSPMEPLFFELQSVALPWADEDGDPINSAVLVPIEGHEEAEKEPALGGREAKAYQLLVDLYAQQNANLAGRGSARVTGADWSKAMAAIIPNSSHRCYVRNKLIEKGKVREEAGFVYVV